MKIKIWAFVLIIAGTVAVSCLGTFAALRGFTAVAGVVKDLRQARAATAQLPGRWNNPQIDRSQGEQGGTQGNALPANFNAGVSIPATYGAMTDRSEDEVLAAAEKAGTDTWGLAQQEGKLDELKQKVLAAVEDSLRQMVTKGTITQSQSDSYLNWVNLYVKSVGTDVNTSATPANGRGRGNGSGWRQIVPGATADPGSRS